MGSTSPDTHMSPCLQGCKNKHRQVWRGQPGGDISLKAETSSWTNKKLHKKKIIVKIVKKFDLGHSQVLLVIRLLLLVVMMVVEFYIVWMQYFWLPEMHTSVSSLKNTGKTFNILSCCIIKKLCKKNFETDQLEQCVISLAPAAHVRGILSNHVKINFLLIYINQP